MMWSNTFADGDKKCRWICETPGCSASASTSSPHVLPEGWVQDTHWWTGGLIPMATVTEHCPAHVPAKTAKPKLRIVR